MLTTVSWHSLSTADTLRHLGSRVTGITSHEVTARLQQYGCNEIARHKPASPLRLLLKQFANFFVWVLLFAAALAFAVSFLPGEEGRRLTAAFILGIIVLSVGLSFFEEYRAQKELDALNHLLVFTTVVIRNSVRVAVDAADIVPGDIIVLTHGQKVPADARVLESYSLRADESALTGESVGVDKSPDLVAAATPLAERTNMVFGSTYITHGTGTAVAVNTGMTTEVGQIAATLQQMAERATPFQVEVHKMARQMTLLVGVLAVLIASLLLFVFHEPWVDVALNTLSLAVTTIPESLPIVLTFALALGARQMAARHAVVRRLSVVESLGSVDTICTDKTGTLTQNSMTVQRLYADGEVVAPSPHSGPDSVGVEVLRAGVLCNEATITEGTPAQIVGDPVDSALVRAAQYAGLDISRERSEWPKVNELPFSSERKMMTSLHQHDAHLIAYTKGAPEAVLARCTSYWQAGAAMPLDATHAQALSRTIAQLQGDGMYVLALARKTMLSSDFTESVEDHLTFVGLQALIDSSRIEAYTCDMKHRTTTQRISFFWWDCR